MREKVIKLNEMLDALIDVAHSAYQECPNEMERVRLDGQIRAYWEVKNHVEALLELEVETERE